MIHSRIDHHRHVEGEARLLTFAAGAEAPAVPDVPPPAEARPDDTAEKVDKPVDPKAAFRGAQDRIKAAGEKLMPLRKSLQQLQKLEADLNAGKGPAAGALEKHGIADTNADGSVKDELRAAIEGIQTEAQKHEADIGAANTEANQHIDAIKKSGPGGAIDAAFMRAEAALKNPAASFGEKIAAIVMVIKDLQDAFKGLNPVAAGGPETGKSGPAAPRDNVRKMMDDHVPPFQKIDDLKNAKKDDITAQEKKRDDLSAEVGTAQTALANAETDLGKANARPKDDPSRDTDIAKATALRDAAKVQLDGLQKAQKQVTDTIDALKEDQKKIAAVEAQGTKFVEKFNSSRTAVRAAIGSMLEKVDDEDTKKDLQAIDLALTENNATLAANGLDVLFKLPAATGTVDFQKAFVDQGITNTADFAIGPDKVVGNPDAMLQGIRQLLQKVEAKTAKAKPATPVEI